MVLATRAVCLSILINIPAYSPLAWMQWLRLHGGCDVVALRIARARSVSFWIGRSGPCVVDLTWLGIRRLSAVNDVTFDVSTFAGES